MMAGQLALYFIIGRVKTKSKLQREIIILRIIPIDIGEIAVKF
jgi:hypothetical protein